jgi:tetratricopeptide (TPR) repeat protein
MRTFQIALLAAAWLQAGLAGAETPEELELRRQAAFRDGMQEIVARLNEGSSDRFIAATRQDEMVDRIFGLRLIDQKVKRQFEDDLEYRYEGLINSAFPSGDEAIRATLLGVESRGDRGRAVVRFDLPDFQFNYHEYELSLDEKNRVVVDDWLDYLQGERFTDGIGMMLVRAAPGQPAVRKLIDFQNVRDSDLFQFTELLKAARDRRADRYVEIINGLDERLRGQRVVVLTSVQLAKQIRNRRMLRTALVEMARYFPDEPLYSLLLLDYYFPARMYEEALRALQRLDDRLGVDDAAMQARLSAATLVMGRAEDANGHADAAVELEPGLELAWWSALRARAAVSDFARAVAALQRLENEFGHQLDRAALERDPGLAGLLDSDEYARWREGGG